MIGRKMKKILILLIGFVVLIGLSGSASAGTGQDEEIQVVEGR
jgi:ABC-type molybdate transport system substrate-binding protein